MQIINQGTIEVPAKYRELLVVALNSSGIKTESEDVYIDNKKAVKIIQEVYGDIEDKLSAIVSSFDIFSIPVEMNITYYGDYTGGYVVRDGEVISLDNDEYTIYSADDKTLVDELKRRGYNVDSILKQMQEA